MTATLDRVGRGLAPEAPAPDAPKCYSCGKPASIQLYVGVCCGRCALLCAGATVGVIASLLYDLGADDA